MKVALLINDRISREKLVGHIESQGGTADQYPTAAKALGMFGARQYDLILLHWQVYPGLKPSDPRIKEIAALIPVAKLNRNLFYWEAALRVIDLIRAEDSPNRKTPVIVVFPHLGLSSFECEDRLSKEAVTRDLDNRQPATVVTSISRSDIIASIQEHLVVE